MTRPEAEKIVGRLSQNSKMPCPSWGLSASHCQAGSLLKGRPGTVCSICYAERGRYAFGAGENLYRYRLERIQEVFEGTLDRGIYVSAFTSLIQNFRYFRWFDTGDIQGREHFRLICDIARSTPKTRHWLPTREFRAVENVQVPKNLLVRWSSTMVDRPPTRVPSGGVASMVYWRKDPPAGAFVCRAKENGGRCDTCRACWDKTVPLVAYPARHTSGLVEVEL